MLDVLIVPVLRDNYSYLVVDSPSRESLIIDPPEVEPVLQRLEQEGLKPHAIWLTHHHSDHIAGVPGILKLFPNLTVVGSVRDAQRIPQITQSVKDGDILRFGGEEISVLEVPGHAEGHVAYHFPKSGHLFCGDVIFGASCGAVFGNTYREMYESVSRVTKLPPETKLWVGHEYTKKNLEFAEAVLGEEALRTRKDEFKVPSVPLTLEQELKTNAFMRLETPEVLSYVSMEPGNPEATFKALRQAKDRF